MNTLHIVARILHIGIGIFWAGTIFFLAILLEPAMRAMGPDGGKVMQALQKKHYLVIIPLAAVITILSGVVLMWTASGGFSDGWFSTSFGMTLSIGSTAAILAFVMGMTMLRPTAARVGILGASLQGLEDDLKRESTLAQMDALRQRVTSLVRVIAVLLAIAVVLMAIARYV